MDNDSLLRGVGAGVALVTLGSVPAISGFIIQLGTREQRQEGVYEDVDGRSTEEAMAKFSNKLSKFLVLFFAAVGFVASIVVGVLVTQGHRQYGPSLEESWLSAGAWGLLMFQAIAIASCRKSVRAYDLGIYSFLTSVVLAVVLLVQATAMADDLLRHEPVLFAFGAVELSAVLALAGASLSLQRRPDVFDERGKAVDRMFTISAFSRFNFSWPAPILSLAAKKNNLDMADLASMSHIARADKVSEDWKRRNYQHRLWVSLLRAYWLPLTIQWVLTLVTSFLNFAPQWVILQLLRILENRVPGTSYGLDVWMWVFWLGMAIVVESWVESYLYWLSWCQITIPIRSQLSALIFEKAMRRKDVKGDGKPSKRKQEAGSEEGSVQNSTSTGTADSTDTEDRQANVALDEEDEEAPLLINNDLEAQTQAQDSDRSRDASAKDKKKAENGEKGADSDEDDDALAKTRQNTINLISIDTKRLSDFAAFQNMFPGSLFKLMVSLAFLVTLLGWKPLLAGFSTMIAIMPINIYFSKKYSDAQDRLMKVRDEKMAAVTEALQGIRQIKFSALEPEWERKVGEVREKELGCVWDVFLADTALLGCWVTSPIALAAVALAMYAWVHDELTPSVAFVSLGVFKALEVTLGVVPELTTYAVDAWVSVKRIDKYLKGPDIVPVSIESDDISFDGASIAWPSDEEADEAERFVLRDVSITFPRGELSVISGKTGTGKSLMLAAILGEADLLAGDLYLPKPPPLHKRHDSKANKGNWIIPNSIAYVAQIPWIENSSIRDNILFGLPFDEARYRQTVEICALKKDLEMLSDGENTEIGANGINLSGGQKWRVTLARAIYSRAGILVMDDIFSAVDAHVGRHILEKCLTGELAAGRTRILVTHHVALVESHAKFLVELGEGRVLASGFVSELAEEGVLQKIKSHEQTAAEIREDETTAANSDESIEGGGDLEAAEAEAEAEGNTLSKVTSKTLARKFVEDEQREKGAVQRRVYATYLGANGNSFYWALAVLIFVSVQSFSLGRSWWLRIWTGDTQGTEGVSSVHVLHGLGFGSNGSTSSSGLSGVSHAYLSSYSSYSYSHSHTLGSLHHQSSHFAFAPTSFATAAATPLSRTAADSSVGEHSLLFYLAVYMLLSILSPVLGTLRYFYIYIGSIRASRVLFQKMNFAILHAPLRWLDTVPVGRIVNRFTSDFTMIDSQMANSLSFGASSVLSLVVVVVAAAFVSPVIVAFSFVLLLICAYIGYLYLGGARPAKRLESNAKSPVFEQFGTALNGVATIRGFDKAQAYVERMYGKIDDYSATTWHLWLFNRWMGWRMGVVGSCFAVFVSVLVLRTPGIDAALAGFALAFSIEFASAIIWTIRLYAAVELNMNAAERVIEYAELKTEKLEGERPPASWPAEGRIEVRDLVVGYAPDLPPVLKGLGFTVRSGERVGVMGRTGAGKSSLTLALFRFLEATSGSVHIDGLDISKIRLHDLRSRLAIIPQDPVLFSGTVRSNLDPFRKHDEATLRDSLRRVHLVSDDGESASASGVATPATAVPEPSASAAATATAAAAPPPVGEDATGTLPLNIPPSAEQAATKPSSVTASSSTGVGATKNLNVFRNLDSAVSEGGLNLSQGQRQLLCLARAIVSRPRVMVLDEATSAVDMETDGLIQRSIREEFTDASLIVIAHRLSTIADFDRILVLSDGRVAEFGTPRELWDKGPTEGVFRAMCEESGERDKLRRIVLGEGGG